MEIYKQFKDNLLQEVEISLANKVKGQRVCPISINQFTNHLTLLVPYFCHHPARIIREMEELKEDALNSVISYLHEKTNGRENVWHGNIGEIIATTYILSCTDYVIPVFKLRFATNKSMSMHGDDQLGFRFDDKGNPKSLLVIEAKNYLTNLGKAVELANEGLFTAKEKIPTLFDFIINQLYEKNESIKARLIEKFLEEYNNTYDTEFLAFIITDKALWKNSYFTKACANPATPLKIIAFLVSEWQQNQSGLTLNSNEIPEPKEPQLHLVDEYEVIKEIKNLLDNSLFKNHQSQLASSILTSELNITRRARYHFDELKLEKAAKYLTYSAFRLMKLNSNSDDVEVVLKEAATIYERLSAWRIENNDVQGALRNIIDGAILYCVAGYNANAKVLIERIIVSKEIESNLELGNIQTFFMNLVAGNLVKLQDNLAKTIFEIDRKNNKINVVDAEEEWMEILECKVIEVGILITANAFSNLLQFLRTGKDIYVEQIENSLKVAAKHFAIVGDYSSYNLVNAINQYFASLIKNSTQRIILTHLDEDKESWRLYLRLLSTSGNIPVTTLWKSQRKAIQEGLLEDKSLVLSMPTSAGKTKTVELAIYSTLKEEPDKICIYIVPTRALASEVEDSLSRSFSKLGFGVSILYGGYDSTSFEEDIINENKVFVLTPEKADLLIRSTDTFKSKIGIIIIDEVHDAASSNTRSLRTEFIFSRLFYIAERNKARVICLSAVIGNPSDFAKWATGDENNKVEIDWRPTSKRFGVFEWGNGSARVTYKPIENNYPSGDFYVPLPFTYNNLKARCKNSLDLSVEIVARLAIYYSSTGSTLVFATTKTIVNFISDKLLTLINSGVSDIFSLPISDSREELVKSCENILGSNHKLVRAIKLGFAYHYSDLPRNIRKLIENGIKDNAISLIICTTTLSQGVNLPIRNVILHSSYHNKLSIAQVSNAVGRAGRAGFETEGHIVFCNREDMRAFFRSGQRENAESFITSGLKTLLDSRLPSSKAIDDFIELWALASTKQFRSDGSTLEDWKKTKSNNADRCKAEILSILDSQLLAWVIESAIDEVSDEEVTKLCSKLLFDIQVLNIPELSTKFKAGLRNRAIKISSRVPELPKRKLFNSTGLSVSSNEAIDNYVQSFRQTIDEYKDSQTLPQSFWEESYKVFKELPELSDISAVKVKVLIAWINGESYKDIAENYFKGKIEDAIRSIEKLTINFPWGLNSLIQHLKFHVGSNNLPSVLVNLPSFALNGVSNIKSVYAISLGLYDREIASLISGAYPDFDKVPDFKVFKEWLFSLTLERWNEILPEINDRNLLECFNRVQAKQAPLTNTLNILNLRGCLKSRLGRKKAHTVGCK